MQRRSLLSGTALAGVAALAGCFDRVTGTSGTVDPTFERTDSELDAADPPAVTVEDGTVEVRGTVRYASSQCGTVELRHAGYERSQSRLDLLVAAADRSEDFDGCTDDMVEAGYRVEATVSGRLRRVTVTEHHAFGESYSTTVDGL